MRKSSPGNNSRGPAKGKSNTFKKDDGRGSFGRDSKPSFKKNYDGRSPSGEDRPSRSSKPYSGRVADGGPSARPPRGKDDEHTRPHREFGGGGKDRPAGKSFDRSDRGDKPRGKFDRDSRPPGRSAERPDRGERGDRPFDKPKGKFDRESRPPGRSAERPDRGERGDKPFDKPRGKFDRDSRPPGRSAERPDRGDKPFDKPRGNFNRDDRPSRDSADRADRGERGEKRYDKPRDGGDRASGPRSDRPFRGARDNDGASDRGRGFEKREPKADTRPFRNREKPTEDKKGKGPRPEEQEEEKPTFKDVMNKAFNQPKGKKNPDDDIIMKPEQFEDKVFGELEDVKEDARPKPIYGKKKGGKTPDAPPPPPVKESKKGRKKKLKDYDDDDAEDDDDIEINQTNGPRLEMPLNKYIAHSGECSRRDAAGLVKQGKVKVNDELVLDPGYRVKHDDRVTMSGKKLVPQTGLVYILLNKPKGFITTNEDPQGRKTVMDLVANSGDERIFPVGRLDKETSGLLLITNDGELTQKLCHPSYNVKKVYHVTTDKPVTHADFEAIIAGVTLDDGEAKVDALAYLDKKTELGLEIHSGRNRIVRRIFESLGYEVVKLDRVMYAGLTKKNLPRSKWRYLNDREIILLKHFKN